MGFHLDFHWDFCLNKYSQTSTANKIYAMKPKESPNENPNEQPFWQWTYNDNYYKTNPSEETYCIFA